MRTRWYGGDTGLTLRMFLAMFLLAAVYLAFLAVLWWIGVEFLPLVVIASGLLLVQYFLSDQLVLLSMGARIVTPAEAPELHGIIDRLSALGDLPKPKVAIVNSNIPNAFATGRNQSNSVVAVTTSLLDRLNRQELEAVIAHELTHIKNRDVAVITIASFLSTVAFFILRSSMFGGFGYGRGRGRNGGSIILVYLASLLAWAISFLLIRALSRYREYAADRGAAILTGAPSQLASALIRISNTIQRIPDRDLREVEGMNAFFIVPAVSRSSIAELFSSHPSVQNRIERLSRMQQEMEGL
ncbi:MAG: zinc metalloprotease HtpX [Chloroflexota bacterium]|jgi:heat shock protein HtpX